MLEKMAIIQNYHQAGCKNYNFQFNNRFYNKEEMRSFISRLKDYAISRKSLSVLCQDK